MIVYGLIILKKVDKKEPIFEDSKNICLIDDDIDKIVDRILYYKYHLDEFYDLYNLIKSKFYEVFNIESQVSQRIKILNSIIKYFALYIL